MINELLSRFAHPLLFDSFTRSFFRDARNKEEANVLFEQNIHCFGDATQMCIIFSLSLFPALTANGVKRAAFFGEDTVMESNDKLMQLLFEREW